jgi:hypothetical protein
VKRHGAVVTRDASGDGLVGCEGGFLVEGGAGGNRVFAVVGSAVYRSDFATGDVQVVDIVPLEREGFVILVDADGEPDIAGFPKRDGVPLVAEVKVCSCFGAVDAQREAGLRVEGAGAGWGNWKWLGPGA